MLVWNGQTKKNMRNQRGNLVRAGILRLQRQNVLTL